MDNRAVAPAVEKLLTVGLVLLFVGATMPAVFGGAVPRYRAGVGAEVGERVLAAAATEIEAAVPPHATEVAVTRRVALPPTISDAAYTVRTDGRRLVLDHPSTRVSAATGLALPATVVAVRGRWQSGVDGVVTVNDAADGLVVRLAEAPE